METCDERVPFYGSIVIASMILIVIISMTLTQSSERYVYKDYYEATAVYAGDSIRYYGLIVVTDSMPKSHYFRLFDRLNDGLRYSQYCKCSSNPYLEALKSENAVEVRYLYSKLKPDFRSSDQDESIIINNYYNYGTIIYNNDSATVNINK